MPPRRLPRLWENDGLGWNGQEADDQDAKRLSGMALIAAVTNMASVKEENVLHTLRGASMATVYCAVIGNGLGRRSARLTLAYSPSCAAY